MAYRIIHIDETDSTNRWLKQHGGDDDVVVVADYQTAGRGCGTNRWESERGQNLLFSVLTHPKDPSDADGVRPLPARQQFQVSMAMSLAIADALGQYIGDVSIKWPNDIYWRNAKICGMLIEHTLVGRNISSTIIGVGLNVNQRQFVSDAPNPVSLWQITEQLTDRDQLLTDILQRYEQLSGGRLKQRYLSQLYRRKGFHPYVDGGGVFMAELADVEDDGHLVLSDESAQRRRYAFKEVQFVI